MENVQVHINPQVQGTRDLHGELLSPSNYQRPIREQLTDQAERLHEAHRAGDQRIRPQVLSASLPQFKGLSMEGIMKAEFTLADAQRCICWQYGYQKWDEVEALGDKKLDLEFEEAVDALLRGDLEKLQEMADINPALITQESAYGHRATLLHYTGSNGVEFHRQVVPMNLAKIVEFLLASGADPSLKANIYGGSTAYQLVVTSQHPYDAGVIEEVKGKYLEADA